MIQSKVWLSWLKWISWFIYSYEALLVNQWSGLEGIACDLEASNPCYSTGEQVSLWQGVNNCVTTVFGEYNSMFSTQVLQRLSFEEGNLGRDIGMLILLAVAIRSRPFKMLCYNNDKLFVNLFSWQLLSGLVQTMPVVM